MDTEERIAELEGQLDEALARCSELEEELNSTTAMYDELREENARLKEVNEELLWDMSVAEDLAYRAYTTLAR